MGISTAVVAVTDREILEFVEQPALADAAFSGAASFDRERCCHLHDHWAALHYLLTRTADGGELPLAAIRRGDLTIPGATDPTHAILSGTARSLAAALDAVTEAELRGRFDPAAMLTAGPGGTPIYPGRLWCFPTLAEGTLAELMADLARLRDFVSRAAREGKGLVFCRYEDL
jgi:hypothetical protein